MEEKELVRFITKTAVKAAADVWEQERERYIEQQHDTRLYNTRLLLKNYRTFKLCAGESLFEAEQLEKENISEVFRSMVEGRGENVTIASIQRNAIRTALIVEHIERMIEAYRLLCERSVKPEDKRRFRVIYGLYIADEAHTADEIKEIEHISNGTVYNDIDTATESLSALLFGIGAVELKA